MKIRSKEQNGYYDTCLRRWKFTFLFGLCDKKNEAFLHNDGITYQVYCEGLAEKLHSGVGENHELPALYSCEHGAVTNASFSKFSVPIVTLSNCNEER